MRAPVIVIGAGRSGTNALRDALCAIDGFHTWPCDEINYIWRTGNRGFPTDELLPQHASPQVKAKIAAAFERRAKQEPGARIVEKTCANSLRVGFVAEVFPDAQFVHLVRDGRAVVASARKRWTAPLDVSYLAQKARFVPPLDLPYYATKYLRSHVDRKRSDEDRLSWWGPKFQGMEQFTAETPLVEVAAHQWLACVTQAAGQLAGLPPERSHTLSYRELVSEPQKALSELVSFLGEPADQQAVDVAASTLHGGSLTSWKNSLSDEEQRQVGAIVDDMNTELGVGDQ